MKNNSSENDLTTLYFSKILAQTSQRLRKACAWFGNGKSKISGNRPGEPRKVAMEKAAF